MRRKDREVTDHHEILHIIDACKIIRICMSDKEGLYLVPLNFGYEYKNNQFIFYCHSAKEGRKLDAISSNPSIGFEMDCQHRLIEAKKACNYSFSFQSVIGNGTAVIINENEEKKHGLTLLMKHQTGKDFSFHDSMIENIAVIKITVSSLSAKRHL
jgi:nitroimidazol reductase NimA-like FMN-containing flavoprotein (pyridoxamine 5'-phosphate oxidase superfamily)